MRERLVVAGLFGIPLALAVTMMAWSTERPASAQTTREPGPLGPFVGLVQPSDKVDLACSDKGIIQELTVEDGSTVKKGQVVFKLESSVEEASLKISQAQAETQIDIEAAKYRWQLAKVELDRVTKMDQQNAAAPKEVDTAVINEKYSDALVRKAQHDQQVARFQYLRDQKVVERRVIVSPLDGYVAKKRKSVGELVDGINDAVVCQIARLDPLHVTVPVPASTYGQIRLGQTAALTAEQLPGGRATAKVILVDKIIQADSQTYTIKLELPNPNSAIPAGVKAEVTFP